VDKEVTKAQLRREIKQMEWKAMNEISEWENERAALNGTIAKLDKALAQADIDAADARKVADDRIKATEESWREAEKELKQTTKLLDAANQELKNFRWARELADRPVGTIRQVLRELGGLSEEAASVEVRLVAAGVLEKFRQPMEDLSFFRGVMRDAAQLPRHSSEADCPGESTVKS